MTIPNMFQLYVFYSNSFDKMLTRMAYFVCTACMQLFQNDLLHNTFGFSWDYYVTSTV